ncbi:hypothetical protein ACYSNU_16560 [Enterococcus sp. LJL120]
MNSKKESSEKEMIGNRSKGLLAHSFSDDFFVAVKSLSKNCFTKINWSVGELSGGLAAKFKIVKQMEWVS